MTARSGRSVALTIAVLAASLAGAAAARAETSGGECVNIATDGYELRSPYVDRSTEATVRGVYTSLNEQPVDGQYQYVAYVPATLPDSPVPLVLTMHGLLGTAKQHASQTHWAETADAHGFIVVAPNGHRAWDYTDGSIDLGYLRDVVADVRSRQCLDERRLYVTGHSMGGFMTHRATCDLGDLFAAGASYAAGDLSNGGACTPGVDAGGSPIDGWERMPLANWHGDDDAIVGYGAGRRGMANWLERYDCDTTPTVVEDRFGRAETWSDCLDDVILGFRTLDGHGHAWPDNCGGAQSTGGQVDCTPPAGTTRDDWPGANDLTEETWEFVSQFARRDPAVAQERSVAPGPSRPPAYAASDDLVGTTVAKGVETGFDSDATFRRDAPTLATEHLLTVDLTFHVTYTGDGAGLGDSHPVCPTSNAGAGSQAIDDLPITVSATDRSGDVVEVSTVAVADRSGETHFARLAVELPGSFDPEDTVVRATYAGDVTKFWWSCGVPPARYKETFRPAVPPDEAGHRSCAGDRPPAHAGAHRPPTMKPDCNKNR